MKNQPGKKVKALRSENGGEYISKEFADFCAEKGIKWEFIASYTPVQNGVAERMNRTIQERLMSMLSQSYLPQLFWAKALITTVYLINRMHHCQMHHYSLNCLRSYGRDILSLIKGSGLLVVKLMHMCQRSFVQS